MFRSLAGKMGVGLWPLLGRELGNVVRQDRKNISSS